MDLCVLGFTLLLFSLLGLKNAETTGLLEELQNPYTGCYGTHFFQPGCGNGDTVIAVLDTKVGAKPLSAQCPSVVVLHNGQLLDANNLSSVVNESYCCTPDFDTDCIFSKVHDGFLYQLQCTGLTNCSSPTSVFWNQTNNSSCPSPDRGPYLPTTNYMFMEYYCIPTTRTSTISDNVSTSVTSPYYLQSPNYPVNITSGTTNMTCSVTSKTCFSIFLYAIDIRLTSDGGVCKQKLSVSTGDETIIAWDCDNQTYFNITNQTTGYNHVTVRFENENTEEGGNFWIGLQSSDGSEMLLNCPARAQGEMNCQNSNTTSSASMSSQQRTSKNNIFIIVVVSVGGLIVIGLIISFVYCCKKLKQNKKVHDTIQQEGTSKQQPPPNGVQQEILPNGETHKNSLNVDSEENLSRRDTEETLPKESAQGIELNRLAQNNEVAEIDQPYGDVVDTSIIQQLTCSAKSSIPPSTVLLPGHHLEGQRLPPIENLSNEEQSMKRKRKKKRKKRNHVNESESEKKDNTESKSDLPEVSIC